MARHVEYCLVLWTGGVLYIVTGVCYGELESINDGIKKGEHPFIFLVPAEILGFL